MVTTSFSFEIKVTSKALPCVLITCHNSSLTQQMLVLWTPLLLLHLHNRTRFVKTSKIFAIQSHRSFAFYHRHDRAIEDKTGCDLISFLNYSTSTLSLRATLVNWWSPVLFLSLINETMRRSHLLRLVLMKQTNCHKGIVYYICLKFNETCRHSGANSTINFHSNKSPIWVVIGHLISVL